MYLTWIGRVAILTLESGELLCLVVSLNAARKKSNLCPSLEASGSLQLHHLITSS